MVSEFERVFYSSVSVLILSECLCLKLFQINKGIFYENIFSHLFNNFEFLLF